MNLNLLAVQPDSTGIFIVGAVVLIIVVFLFSMFRRYKRCPSDKILVVYGKTGGDESAKCIHGGAALH